MTGPSWVPTIDDAKVRDGAYVAVYPKGLGVLLARIDGDLFAVANKCAHMGVPARGRQARGARPHVSVPRLALRRAHRACSSTRPSWRSRPSRSRSRTARSTSRSGGVTMVDEVYVYALSTCPWCRKTKQWFDGQQDRLRVRRRRHAARRGAGRRRRQGLRAQRRPALPRGRHQRRGDRGLQPRQVPRTSQGLGGLSDGQRRTQGVPALPVRPRGRSRWATSSRPTRSSSTSCSRPEVKTEQDLGAPFCPCQGRTGVRAEDMQICCPCIPFHREHFDAMKRCWCGLFVHLDVTDPDSLPQFPPDEG